MSAGHLIDALEALGRHGRSRGLDLARAATAADPDDVLAAAVVRHLESRWDGTVYTTPTGFRSFIDNRSNLALYDVSIGALRRLHDRLGPRTVVDVGAGDGRVAAATVGDGVTSIHLVEPAAELLDQALTGQHWPTPPTPHPSTVQDWLSGLDPGEVFDLVQATFALNTLPRDERTATLRSLRGHSGTVAVVEFDVPSFVDGGTDHAGYAVDRYRRALREYHDLPDAIDGFLVPVLIAQFDPTTPRVTFEQPAERWVDDFETAGFSAVVEPLHDYWWADAFLLTARPR